MTHILLIDDDTDLSAMLGEYLSVEHFIIDYAYDGRQGLKKTLTGKYDLVVLDVMMPELDGFEVLRRIRSESSVPVIMLTAKDDNIDRIVGLEIGADDYLPKPFNPRELLARLRAILRRTQTNTEQEHHNPVAQIGALEVNSFKRTASINGRALDLTSAEFNLLHTLVKQAGKIVSKDTLTKKGLGRGLEKYDRSVDMHMSNLRKKMALHNLGSMIITVRGQGYQLANEA